jgi:hypothetical protein
MRSELVLAFALAFALGCGDGLPTLDGDAGVDVDSGPFTPGPHPALPQATNTSGTGGVLTSPTVVPIFFANDALQSGIEGLLAQLPASSYWSALGSDYGVGPLTVAPSIVVTDSPPQTASETDVISFIASKLGSDPAWPANAPGTIYFVYYPSSTTLTLAQQETGCVDFEGYHDYGQNSPTSKFVFAVAARCTSQIATIDDVTQTTTHELVEASTDPFLLTYSEMDPAHAVWSLFPGAELGDLCELEALSYQRLVGSSLVARFWSNSAAAAGHDPCAPAIDLPYFNSIPVFPDQVGLSLGNGTFLTDGVIVPVGTSKTIDVQLFSDAPTGDWLVEADDAANFENVSPGELQFVWSNTTGNNGDTLQLTITRLKASPFGGTEFVIRSFASATVSHVYMGYAGN